MEADTRKDILGDEGAPDLLQQRKLWAFFGVSRLDFDRLAMDEVAQAVLIMRCEDELQADLAEIAQRDDQSRSRPRDQD